MAVLCANRWVMHRLIRAMRNLCCKTWQWLFCIKVTDRCSNRLVIVTHIIEKHTSIVSIIQTVFYWDDVWLNIRKLAFLFVHFCECIICRMHCVSVTTSTCSKVLCRIYMAYILSKCVNYRVPLMNVYWRYKVRNNLW